MIYHAAQDVIKRLDLKLVLDVEQQALRLNTDALAPVCKSEKDAT
jgi:hypothetical protein